jgi:hypothetical protein
VLRVLLALLALAAIGALTYTQWLRPRPASDPSAIHAAAFYSYDDATGTQVIVGSLAQIPPERRPFARRIEFDDTALRIEARPDRDVTSLRRDLQDLALRLGSGSTQQATSLQEVLTGLAAPVGGMLLLGAMLFWLAARLRDGFVRWTLRTLVLFVLVVGLVRGVGEGVLGRPGLRALKREGRALPVDMLAPALRDVIRQATVAPPAGTLGGVPPGVDPD